MKRALNEGLRNALKLVRFLFWYAAVLGALLYLLPMAAGFAERHYEAMGGMARLFTVIGFIALILIWQIRSERNQGKKERRL